MAMAVANRDVIFIIKEGEAAILDRDGFGVSPDGAIYEEKTDGQYYWFVCLTCNGLGADKPHCCSGGHRTEVRAHLQRTIGRQARASASAAVPPAAEHPAKATATTAARPKMALPPPPS